MGLLFIDRRGFVVPVVSSFNYFATSLSRDAQRDVSIDVEMEEEWGAVSLDPSQPLMAQKVLHTSVHPSLPPSLHLTILPSPQTPPDSSPPFVSTGDRWSVGMPALAQGAELVFLQAVDEPRPFSIFLPVLSLPLTRAGLHVPLRRPLVAPPTSPRALKKKNPLRRPGQERPNTR